MFKALIKLGFGLALIVGFLTMLGHFAYAQGGDNREAVAAASGNNHVVVAAERGDTHQSACEKFSSWSEEEVQRRKAQGFETLLTAMHEEGVVLTVGTAQCAKEYILGVWIDLAKNCGADPKNADQQAQDVAAREQLFRACFTAALNPTPDPNSPAAQ